jgi:glutamate-1-semialdehyde 2,1-aminomutase
MAVINRSKLQELLEKEEREFADEHPRSRALFERAKKSLLAGVPMNWMIRWAGPFPLFAREGKGARVVDVDGHVYVDFCLGDSGSMFGHSPQAVVDAVREQVSRGITMMLPTEDSIWVGEELARRFRLPYWQVAMTATDANRFSVRLAREVTGRPRILVVNGCYHGSVDESLVDLRNGRAVARTGNIGPPMDPSVTTKVIEFNDLDALKQALAPGDVAAVLIEPAMTNRGIILPDPSYHEGLREITRATGTLLILDETHTICAGPAGYTGAHGLEPDMLTLGKPIASGVPAAAYGVSGDVADRILEKVQGEGSDESGIGGTLTGNALAAAAMRATLAHVITAEAYARAMPLAESFEIGVAREIREYGVPWHATRLGVRVEYRFRSTPPRNGTQAERAKDALLDRYMHLAALNRGILMTPFHNMALLSAYHVQADVDLHNQVFRESLGAVMT